LITGLYDLTVSGIDKLLLSTRYLLI